MRTLTLVTGVVIALLTAAPASAQYAGMPRTDRAWTYSDLQPAATSLASATDLPRLTNDSRAVLERLSAPAVLDFCRDRGVPILQRLQPCIGAFGAEVEILRAYTGAMERDPTRADDVMRVAEALLFGAGMANQIMNEFVPTLDPNDPSYATRMSGVDQTKRGLTTMFTGAITMLTERNLYSVAARTRFAAVVAQTYPQAVSSFTPEARAGFEQTLRDIARNDESAEIRAALASFNS